MRKIYYSSRDSEDVLAASVSLDSDSKVKIYTGTVSNGSSIRVNDIDYGTGSSLAYAHSISGSNLIISDTIASNYSLSAGTSNDKVIAYQEETNAQSLQVWNRYGTLVKKSGGSDWQLQKSGCHMNSQIALKTKRA